MCQSILERASLRWLSRVLLPSLDADCHGLAAKRPSSRPFVSRCAKPPAGLHPAPITHISSGLSSLSTRPSAACDGPTSIQCFSWRRRRRTISVADRSRRTHLDSTTLVRWSRYAERGLSRSRHSMTREKHRAGLGAATRYGAIPFAQDTSNPPPDA